MSNGKRKLRFLLLTAVAGLGFAAAVVAAVVRSQDSGQTSPSTSKLSALHPIHIRKPADPPRVLTGMTNLAGQPATVACSTCHSTTTPDASVRTSAELDQFHQGLHFQHGQLACLSCHNAANYDTLRLANGEAVPYPEVMRLCGQCHGTQLRDYQHGAHGGMTGYWDLARGPRERNNCIHCHDPHAPKYPEMMPVFAPKDRDPTGVSKPHKSQ